jgi:hypothetical protein
MPLIPTYDIATRVGVPLILIYDLPTRVRKPLILIYDLPTRVGMPLILIYDLPTRVGMPLILIYDLPTRAGMPFISIYGFDTGVMREKETTRKGLGTGLGRFPRLYLRRTLVRLLVYGAARLFYPSWSKLTTWKYTDEPSVATADPHWITRRLPKKANNRETLIKHLYGKLGWLAVKTIWPATILRSLFYDNISRHLRIVLIFFLRLRLDLLQRLPLCHLRYR